eukprot:5543265-Amphidinium_carterae.1
MSRQDKGSCHPQNLYYEMEPYLMERWSCHHQCLCKVMTWNLLRRGRMTFNVFRMRSRGSFQ